jgi:hypothetical protein
MIRFRDFFKVPDENKTKIKFNMNAGDINKRAWDFLRDDDPEWLKMNGWKTKQTNNNLNKADYLIALAQYYPYGPEYYVFGGIYKIEKTEPEVFDAVGYSLVLAEDYKEYIKRLIIRLREPIGQNAYNRWYKTIQEQLEPEIYELAPDTKLGSFPGYQKVCLMHKDMQLIISRSEPSWKQALSQVKGVYAITDTSNGKLYIGSASGNTEGIWQRWAAYADIKDMTGGNKAFLNIAEVQGRAYIERYFQYAIIEIFDVKTKKEDVLTREEYWKKVFCSKRFGYNM